MTKKHIDITINGKVQGVFFRKYAIEKALELGLTGFVRNESDGSVYCEAEGDERVLETFRIWCYKGSPLSKVINVVITETEMKHFTTFEMKR